MENGNSGPTRTLVIPGEILGEGDLKAGKNTYRRKDKVYASQMGFKTVHSNFVNVIPLGGRYIPKPDDLIIGVIQQVSPTTWLVDINSPYPAPLHVNEVPWRVDFGDTARYLSTGNTILARVFLVDEVKRIQVTMKDQGSRKLAGGQIIEISPSKVPRIIGKGGSMISLIKQKTMCRLFVGQNGRIWIDGETENITIAVNAIRYIERESHRFGLTEAVERYLSEMMVGKPQPEQMDQPVHQKQPEQPKSQGEDHHEGSSPREQPPSAPVRPAEPHQPAQDHAAPPTAPFVTGAEKDVKSEQPLTQPEPKPEPSNVAPLPFSPKPGPGGIPHRPSSPFSPPDRTQPEAVQPPTPGPEAIPVGDQVKKPENQVLKDEEFERMSD